MRFTANYVTFGQNQNAVIQPVISAQIVQKNPVNPIDFFSFRLYNNCIVRQRST